MEPIPAHLEVTHLRAGGEVHGAQRRMRDAVCLEGRVVGEHGILRGLRGNEIHIGHTIAIHAGCNETAPPDG